MRYPVIFISGSKDSAQLATFAGMIQSCPEGSSVEYSFVLLICRLRQRFQARFDQGPGAGWVVNAQALVLMRDVDPVPESSSFRFWDRCHRWMTFFIEPAQCNQTRFKFIQPLLDLGLQASVIEAFHTRVACLAGGHVRLKGVAAGLAQMAGDTGVFHHGVVRAGAALDLAGAGQAK